MGDERAAQSTTQANWTGVPACPSWLRLKAPHPCVLGEGVVTYLACAFCRVMLWQKKKLAKGSCWV